MSHKLLVSTLKLDIAQVCLLSLLTIYIGEHKGNVHYYTYCL